MNLIPQKDEARRERRRDRGRKGKRKRERVEINGMGANFNLCENMKLWKDIIVFKKNKSIG